jgi:hypothetical protein
MPNRETLFLLLGVVFRMRESESDRSADEHTTQDAPPTAQSSERSTPSPVERSQQLLDATRQDASLDSHLRALEALDPEALEAIETDRRAALAFWINCYNAGTQLLLQRRPALYESRLWIFRLFRVPCLSVAGTALSLDDIEHGILRGSRSKYGFGYVPRLFPSPFERRYRFEEPDPRIHFALNCGSNSCPPIRFYEPDRIDEQLDLATRGYLEPAVEYDAAAGTARVPKVFSWYRGDFGGESGIVSLLKAHEIVPADASVSIEYTTWDWTRAPGKFVS